MGFNRFFKSDYTYAYKYNEKYKNSNREIKDIKIILYKIIFI